MVSEATGDSEARYACGSRLVAGSPATSLNGPGRTQLGNGPGTRSEAGYVEAVVASDPDAVVASDPDAVGE